MPIISQIGRRHFKTRCLIGIIYTMLILGSISMVYPFLLMMAGSTKSTVDIKELRIIPGYLTDDTLLYRKYIEGLFNERLEEFKITYQTDDLSFEYINPPTHVNNQLADVWSQFIETTDLPYYAKTTGFMEAYSSRGMQPHLQRKLMSQLSEEFNGDIRAINKELGSEFANWSAFYLFPTKYQGRRSVPAHDPFSLMVRDFASKQSLNNQYIPSIEGYYKTVFLQPQYSNQIEFYNNSHQTNYASYQDIHLTRTFPNHGTDAEKKDWELFVRSTINLLWIRADQKSLPSYHAFLKAKYKNLATINHRYETSYKSIDDIPLVTRTDVTSLQTADWASVIEGWKDPDTQHMFMLPIESLRIHSLDFMFRDFLTAKYGNLTQINAALGTNYQQFLDIQMPQIQWHYREFQKIKSDLKWEFTIRNYITVINYMVLHGRGVFNTVIYCSLAILSALIVNPMAAYAMSRYSMPSTYKILLFLMMTMAFPPMVTQIPNFLMLRELNLLNTFWALILPGLANGYSIFLLKGFFDSLPKELYESACLDGANEWVLFWQITMNLSKPILAVIALSAFNYAYTNFMFALLICQDEKMWTLMVWLYQLQMRSGPGVVFASLLIAALPTFLVFAFAQNIIMRGIVVPVEK